MNVIFSSRKVPILQNKVYNEKLSAINANFGELIIVEESNINLVHNSAFNPELMVYDTSYDNTVPSEIFMKYYDNIADYLFKKYDLTIGTIIDIGCGKGTFIKRMADRFSNINCIGIDPSYEGDHISHNGRLKFITEYFDSKHLEGINTIPLILCRHTLEHIPQPEMFLKEIFSIFKNKFEKDTIPVFIEVPDFAWIIENNAFWDFCYEHTNYFTELSLTNALIYGGAKDIRITKAFQNQYQWAECFISNKRTKNILQNKTGLINTNMLINKFENNIQDTINKVQRLSNKCQIVIWGMATKGIMFTLHLQNNNLNIDYCVDINKNKQGKFTPLTGLQIIPPNQLPKDQKLAIICMNPNYSDEINSLCQNMNINYKLFDTNIKELVK